MHFFQSANPTTGFIEDAKEPMEHHRLITRINSPPSVLGLRPVLKNLRHSLPEGNTTYLGEKTGEISEIAISLTKWKHSVLSGREIHHNKPAVGYKVYMEGGSHPPGCHRKTGLHSNANSPTDERGQHDYTGTAKPSPALSPQLAGAIFLEQLPPTFHPFCT